MVEPGVTGGKVGVDVAGEGGGKGHAPGFSLAGALERGWGAAGRGAAGEGGLVRAGSLNPGNVSSGVSGLPHSGQRESPLAKPCASFQGSQVLSSVGL